MGVVTRNLILASASPRRSEILQNAGIVFSVRVANIEERRGENETPVEYVTRLAREKAIAVRQSFDEYVLGADTTVVAEGAVLEKPSTLDEAAAMLRQLSGRAHEVITGFCLLSPDGDTVSHEQTRVHFLSLTENEIHDYVASGEPFDKAGGYAIQGLASKFVTRIEGCYFNVMGLPIGRVYQLLR